MPGSQIRGPWSPVVSRGIYVRSGLPWSPVGCMSGAEHMGPQTTWAQNPIGPNHMGPHNMVPNIGADAIGPQSIWAQPIGHHTMESQTIESQTVGAHTIGAQTMGSQIICPKAISYQAILYHKHACHIRTVLFRVVLMPRCNTHGLNFRRPHDPNNDAVCRITAASQPPYCLRTQKHAYVATPSLSGHVAQRAAAVSSIWSSSLTIVANSL